MKVIKQMSFLLLMLLLMASFSHCSSAQKLQKDPPVEFGEVYFQNWNAGVKNGGSGLNLFISVTDTSIVLDSVYFRTKSTVLELMPNNVMYVGRFKTDINQPKDIILSSDPKEEYGNQMPIMQPQIPFDLKDGECVISYRKEDKTLFYKITNIKQKEALNYPSAPTNKN